MLQLQMAIPLRQVSINSERAFGGKEKNGFLSEYRTRIMTKKFHQVFGLSKRFILTPSADRRSITI